MRAVLPRRAGELYSLFINTKERPERYVPVTRFYMESMNIVMVGHVDHGKSTVIGRLLADTQALPDGKLEALRELCRRNAKPFEYAFLLDALKDERSQGITIDAARCFFRTAKREYIIIDAPGHIEFLKNMITGASRASAALLVIDAREGICENSRRHGYMLSMLGIKQIAVVVNKMDLVGWDKGVYDALARDYGAFLAEIGISPAGFIPVSATEGDNIAAKSERMSWYGGRTVLEQLDAFEAPATLGNAAFRMPVQGVYKFTEDGDSRRIVAGYVEAGSLREGDEIVFLPSGKRTRVATLEGGVTAAEDGGRVIAAGSSAGFTCTTQVYVRRGDIVCRADEAPCLTGRAFSASLFWLGREPMIKGKLYKLKLGTAKTNARLVAVNKILDASTLESTVKDKVERFDVADVALEFEHELAFDIAEECAQTGRFVVVDGYEISGGGIVGGRLENESEFIPLELAVSKAAREALDEISAATGEDDGEIIERLITAENAKIKGNN